jgi:nicotinamidase-related amidase
MNPTPAALIVVDVQEGLDDPQYGARNNPEAERRIAELLEFWRRNNMPVIFGQYLSSRPDSPLKPGNPGTAIKQAVAPIAGEPVLEKRGNSMFKGTGLDDRLRELGVKKLILVGLATDACISSTAREAKDLGYATTVVVDACATFDRRGLKGERLPAMQVHEMELSILQAGGMTVCSAASVIHRSMFS